MIPRIEFDPGASVPLSGIRVVDLSRLVAGNMVSLQLADQGAEVIKIEDPKIGDPLRACAITLGVVAFTAWRAPKLRKLNLIELERQNGG